MWNPALLIPIIAIGGPFTVAIIAMMIKHQQRMAELYHRNVASDPRIDALERRVAELTEAVHAQTIALDNYARPLLKEERVQERIGG